MDHESHPVATAAVADLEIEIDFEVARDIRTSCSGKRFPPPTNFSATFSVFSAVTPACPLPVTYRGVRKSVRVKSRPASKWLAWTGPVTTQAAGSVAGAEAVEVGLSTVNRAVVDEAVGSRRGVRTVRFWVNAASVARVGFGNPSRRRRCPASGGRWWRRAAAGHRWQSESIGVRRRPQGEPANRIRRVNNREQEHRGDVFAAFVAAAVRHNAPSGAGVLVIWSLTSTFCPAVRKTGSAKNSGLL